MGLLALLFIGIPLLEIVVFIVVGSRIGVLATIAIVVITGLLGAMIAMRQGAGVMAQAQAELRGGAFPARSLAHGAMVLVGAVLLVTPGFITDIVGFSLMAPPVREWLRRWGSRRFASRNQIIDI